MLNPYACRPTIHRILNRAVTKILPYAVTALAFSVTSTQAGPIVTIEQLGTTAPMMSPSDSRALYYTQDGKHYAFVSGEGSRQQVIIDGIAGPFYTQAGSQQIQRFTLRSDPNYPERPPAYVPSNLSIAFKRGGAEAIYIAQKEGNAHLVVAHEGTHQEWPSLGQLQTAALSPGGLFVYAIYSNRINREYTTRMIINGTLSPENLTISTQPSEFTFHEPEEGSAHYAYIGRSKRVNQADYYQVFIDGVPGPEFQSLNGRQVPLSFVEKDRKLAVVYLARATQETGERLVFQYLDGTTEQSEPGVDSTSVRISADKTSVGWIHAPAAQVFSRVNRPTSIPLQVFVNGEEKFAYEAAPNEIRNTSRTFRLSPDGSRWAVQRMIQGNNGTINYMLLDGQRGPEYQSIERSAFTAGTQRHYFVARNGRAQFVVIDGVEYGPFNQISQIVSSDSGQSIFWHATTDNGGALYLNGNPVTFEETSTPQIALRFRPGTEDYVALVQQPAGLILHVGSRKYKTNSRDRSGPIFSQDGSRIALFGEFFTGPGQPASKLLIDGEPLMTIDESVNVDAQAWKGFSPDNKHFLCFATTREKATHQNRQAGTLLVDGFELGPLFYNSAIDARAPHFHEDGRFSFYGIYDKEIRRITIDLEAARAYGQAHFEAAQKSGGKTIFTVDPELKLKSLGSLTVRDETTIYGVAQGGEYGMGALYRANSDGSNFQVLHTFLGGGEHVQNPSSLVLGNDGYLYGTAGPNSFNYRRPAVIGGLFRIRTDGSGYEVVKTWEHSNKFASSPILECLAPDGTLLARGPVPNPGRVASLGLLKIDPNTGDISEIYRSTYYPENGTPVTKLLIPFDDGGDGYYYGFDYRNLYRFQLDGQAPESIHEFKGFPLDGEAVNDMPLFHGDWLYGMTRGGGKNRLGIIYRMKRNGSEYEVLLHQEKNENFLALAAGPSGVWGYRNGFALLNGRQSRIPHLERLDKPGTEPLVLEKTRLSNNLWMGKYEGEPALFSLSGSEISVIGMNTDSNLPPELSIQTIPTPPLRDATHSALAF